MGADYKDQGEAIEELSALSSAAKQCLLHHICNALNGVIGGIQIGRNDLALDAAWHIVADLEMMGIRSTKTQIRETARINEDAARGDNPLAPFSKGELKEEVKV